MIKKIIFLLFMLSILGIQTIILSASSDYEHEVAMYRLQQIYSELNSHEAYVIELQQMFDNDDIGMRQLFELAATGLISWDEMDKITGVVPETADFRIDICQNELEVFITNGGLGTDIASSRSIPSFLQGLPLCVQELIISHIHIGHLEGNPVLAVEFLGPIEKLCTCGVLYLPIVMCEDNYAQEVNSQIDATINRSFYNFFVNIIHHPRSVAWHVVNTTQLTVVAGNVQTSLANTLTGANQQAWIGSVVFQPFPFIQSSHNFTTPDLPTWNFARIAFNDNGRPRAVETRR